MILLIYPTCKSLYGLDNFYYRRSVFFVAAFYVVYTDLIISTIVDSSCAASRYDSLYGLDNFYYRRYL